MTPEQRLNLRKLSCFSSDDGIYIDFDSYVVPHGKPDPDGEDTYSCWRFTLCLEEDKLRGSYFELLCNTPSGWVDRLPPTEHLLQVWEDMLQQVIAIKTIVEEL